MPATSSVRVVVRTRPTSSFAADCLKVHDDKCCVTATLPKGGEHGKSENAQDSWTWRYDSVLHNASQDTAYADVSPVVKSVLQGYNGTIIIPPCTDSEVVEAISIEITYGHARTEVGVILGPIDDRGRLVSENSPRLAQMDKESSAVQPVHIGASHPVNEVEQTILVCVGQGHAPPKFVLALHTRKDLARFGSVGAVFR